MWLSPEEYREYSQLLRELREFGASNTGDVSRYIRSNNLKTRFKHITGVVNMGNHSGDSWKFDGGVSPAIYARLCQDLDFGRKSGNSYVTGFKSYDEVWQSSGTIQTRSRRYA